MADLPITSDQGATPIVVNDPTTTANVANVKAASTAAVAADNSLVVALSPNSPVPTGTNNIGVTGVAQGSTTSGEHGDLIQGAVTTAAPTYVTGQTSPLSLTTVGNLRVDGSSVTQPVSGTVTANQGTANTAANKWPIEIVDSGGVNIATVNATNELLVTDTDLTLAQGSTTSGQLGPLVQGAVTTAAPTYVTAQTSPLSLTTAGALRTDSSATTQPVSGTVAVTQSTSPWVANITQWASTALGAPSNYGTPPGTVEVIGVNAFVTNTVAENITQIAGNSVVTAATGVMKVGNTDGSGNNLVASSIAGNNRLLVSSTPAQTEFSLAGKMFGAAANVNLPTSGTETDMILFANPNGSGKTVILQKISFNPSANANGSFRIRVYVTPTTTANGASVTTANLNVGNAATASATVTTGPTVTANGTFIMAGGNGSGTSGNSTTQIVIDGAITLPANSKILITGTPTANNEAVDLTLVWAEV